MSDQLALVIGAVIFGATYLAIASERVDKTLAAMGGGCLMLLLFLRRGKDVFEAAVDFNVIFVLVGMMIIVTLLRQTGFFQWAAVRLVRLADGQPLKILVYSCAVTAVLSAFLDNVTTVLLMAPVTVFVTGELKLDPVPFLVLQVLSANIGGTATLIGDPPNLLVGSHANLDFGAFLWNLGPFVLVLQLLVLGAVALVFRRRLQVRREDRARVLSYDESRSLTDRRLLRQSLVILVLVIAGLSFHGLLHLEASVVTIAGATLLLIVSGRKLDDVLKEVEWTTLGLLVGIFLVVRGADRVGILDWAGQQLVALGGGSERGAALGVLWISGAGAAVVSAVSYTTAMIPAVDDVARTLPEAGNTLWWALALGACLGGNATLMGTAGNMVAVGVAEKSGIKISFWRFLKYGGLVALVSLALAHLYLLLRYV